MPPFVLIAMKITRVIVRAYDNRAGLSAFVTIMMVLAIGILGKFDAAALLFHYGALSLGAQGIAGQSEAVSEA